MFHKQDRVEATLEAVRNDIIVIREQLASLNTHLEMWKNTEAAQNRVIEHLQRNISSHLESDAGVHAELKSDVRRLWWGVGMVLTALIGTIVAGLGAAAA